MSEDKIKVMEIDGQDDLEATINELKSNPDIEYVQPDLPLSNMTNPSDSKFSEQWDLLNNGQIGKIGIDINAIKAWSITKGNPTVEVGVLDTGIDINHEDLKDNIDTVNGYNFIDNNKTVFDSATSDFHGTAIAGIIAASENNILSLKGLMDWT